MFCGWQDALDLLGGYRDDSDVGQSVRTLQDIQRTVARRGDRRDLEDPSGITRSRRLESAKSPERHRKPGCSNSLLLRVWKIERASDGSPIESVTFCVVVLMTVTLRVFVVPLST